MKQLATIFFCFAVFFCNAQNEQEIIKTPKKPEKPATKVFYSQKLINTKTVEVLHKGILEFNVSHNFGDIGGSMGGSKTLFGLDGIEDVRIGFQVGLSEKFNVLFSRSKGSDTRKNSDTDSLGVFNDGPKQFWELGAKWQLMQQRENDPQHPFSLTLFTNAVASSMQSPLDFSQNDTSETSFTDFSSRLSEVVQLMIGRKFGNFSFQLSPTYVHRSTVQKNFNDIPIDEENLFAIGGAARIPLSKKIIIIMDYFHTFHPQEFKDELMKAYPSRYIKFYDPIGIGIEILTQGHVFHLNFTNATNILENRIIPRTTTSWGNGQYRWGFTISRGFVLFRKKT